jgi:hypothetical protein
MLHVAAIGVWFNDDVNATIPEEPWTQFYRLHVEQDIIWQITAARNGGGLPQLNKK